MNKEFALAAAVGRILLAVLFLFSGIGKLMAPQATQAYIAAAGLPVPVLAYAAAVAVELGGGILLVLGYRVRLVAVVMALFTIAAALGFHNNFSDQNQLIHFLKNISIAGGLLQIAAFGGGPLSIDGRRSSGRT